MKSKEPEHDPMSSDELFVHGLLESQRLDGDHERQQRVDRVMHAVDAGAVPELLLTAAPSRRTPILVAAAALVICALVLWISRQEAMPEAVQKTVQGFYVAPELSYRFEVLADEKGDVLVSGHLDLGGGGEALLRAQIADGKEFVIGRNADGDWNGVGHMHDHDLPPWLQFEHGGIALDSLDRMLSHLEDSYVLHSVDSTKGSEHLETFRATRSHGQHHLPDLVDLSIDPVSRTLHRVVMRHRADRGPGLMDHLRHLLHDIPLPSSDGAEDHRIVFELEEREPFPPGWFDPETHRPK